MNLATATQEELKAWAFENLALNLSMTMKQETMIERILAACTEKGIDPPANKIETAHGKKAGYITINIAKDKSEGGAEPVFIGVQGKGILVPRGMNIDIPYPYAVALENAKQDIVTQDEDGKVMKETVYQYPYQIINGELKPEHRANQI